MFDRKVISSLAIYRHHSLTENRHYLHKPCIATPTGFTWPRSAMLVRLWRIRIRRLKHNCPARGNVRHNGQPGLINLLPGHKYPETTLSRPQWINLIWVSKAGWMFNEYDNGWISLTQNVDVDIIIQAWLVFSVCIGRHELRPIFQLWRDLVKR